jgi:protein tyrosine phosphatase (PTP) superfamily phosphohydrolase (DUF442 family)/cytochrome c556
MTKLQLLVPVIVFAAACQQPKGRSAATPPPPLKDVSNAYEAADRVKLPETKPEDWSDLHNVYHLSENVISGSEPHGEEALKRLSKMGVKTILSVDGKVPDAETAKKYGMRYVHVPIQYKGLTDDEILKIAKTFREADGPFYVHCFHGKHRGPAGAAVGRMVLDGADREEVLAEMRQWCGTAEKYEGLYRTVATAPMPTEAATRQLKWDMPAASPLGGFRDAMIRTARHFDNLKLLAANEWQRDPEHPDLDAHNEATIFHGIFAGANGLDEVHQRPDDFREWMTSTEKDSATLVEAVKGGDASGANQSFGRIKKTCGACHSSYRNE